MGRRPPNNFVLSPWDIARFNNYVDKRGPDECWPWRLGTNPNGYATFWVGKRRTGAHRVAFYLHYGHYPVNLACHTCDYRSCTNGTHLFDGTDSDNQLDAVRKGRHMLGEQVNTAILTVDKVREIRKLWAQGGVQAWQLSAKFWVDEATIQDILRGRSWKHVV